MHQNNKQILTGFFLFIFLFSFVAAAPPQQISDTTLILESAFPTTHKLGEDYYIHTHVYDKTNEQLVTSGISCYYHFYNHQINGGEHISVGNLTLYGMGYSNTVDGSLINVSGEYSALIWCNSSTQVGFNKYTFEVNPTGFIGTLGFYIILIILSLGVIALGFSINDATTVILGSFGFVLFGLFIFLYGIDGIKDSAYTWGIGIITIMLGAYFGIRAAVDTL